jgi:hypothetical protein
MKLPGHGHSVFCLAPYHPDLKPIKKVSKVKGWVALRNFFIVLNVLFVKKPLVIWTKVTATIMCVENTKKEKWGQDDVMT